jgi:hypothetical protein
MWVVFFCVLCGTTFGLLPFQALLGHSRSFFTFHHLPSAVAQQALSSYDPSLCLGKQSVSPTGSHPIVLMLNYMTKLHTVPVQVAYFSSDYNEFIAAIPFVRACSNSSSEPLSTSSILYLDNEMAVIGGRLFYGMPKVKAAIQVVGKPENMASVSIKSEIGRQLVLFSSVVDFTSAPLSYSSVAGYATVADMFSTFQLLMKQRFELGVHFCSLMTFAFQNATFRSPSSIDFELQADAIPGLKAFNVSLDGFAAGGSAIFFESDWSLSKPLQEC